MTSKKLFGNTLLTLVITYAAILCAMIPEFSHEGGTKILFGSYIGLIILSGFTKNHGAAVVLILSAMALPIVEGLWQVYYFGWDDLNNAILRRGLMFAPFGRISYLLTLIVIPGASLFIGSDIREHRQYKASQ